jgi:hypothetical protein
MTNTNYPNRSIGINDLKLGARVCRFFINNATIVTGGQGHLTISCPALWCMDEETFIDTFGVCAKCGCDCDDPDHDSECEGSMCYCKKRRKRADSVSCPKVKEVQG